MTLARASTGESYCFVSTANGWQYCDITTALLLNDQASQTPATIKCVLASSDEEASAAVDLSSSIAQLGFTDFMVNMEHRDTYPVLNCGIKPDGAVLRLPYNHGAFTPPEYLLGAAFSMRGKNWDAD